VKNLFALILLFSITIHAQEFEFKEVSKEELKQKFHPEDSTAVAAVLWEEGSLSMRYDDGFVYDLEVTKRVKIYNTDGFEYGTVTLPYYYGESSTNRESIKGIKAYVYNLEGNKIVDEKLRRNDFMDENVSEFWSQVKFTFPNLKPGSIIEYTYKYESPNISELPRWNFQDEIPVNYSKYELIIPDMLGYREQQRGFQQLERNTENIKTTFLYRSDNETRRSNSGSSTTDAVVYTYVARNVPKLKDEAFVNNVSNFITSIKHKIAYYKQDDGQVKQFSTTWEEVSKGLQKSESFGQQMDETKYFEDDINPIMSTAQTDDELISEIFSFVKQNIRWNDNNGIYTTDDLKKVYKEKTGNIADINLMLTSMLRYAGIDANPVLISTINHGIPSNFVSREDYNYIITAVNHNQELILLDASSPYSAPNILPIRCINWFGHIIRKNGTTKQISLQPLEKSKDNFILNLNVKEDGTVEGQMRRQYTNHLGYIYRSRYTEVKEEEYIEKKENDYEIDILEYSNKNVENLSDAVVETMTFIKENAADVINDNIYITPLLFLAQKENPFKKNQKERKLPIDFTFPFSNRYIINVEIPDGYAIDYMPEATAVGLPDRKAVFRFNAQKTPDNKIQIVITEDISAAILPPEFYIPLNDYFSQIVTKETDKIVLKKL
jgi:hypothetical protein